MSKKRKNFEQLRERMSEEQRAKADQKYNQLRTEMMVAEIRKLSGMTQQQLADELGVTQPSIAKAEKQCDMEIGTLSSMIEGLGGRLELIAIMPEGQEIRITQFSKPATKGNHQHRKPA